MSMTESKREEIISDIRDGYIDEWDNLTIDELFKQIESEHKEIQQYRAIIGLTPEDLKALEKDEIQTIGDALKAFSEWNQYKEIGTVSEFRELKEKATAKKEKEVLHCPYSGKEVRKRSEGKE